MASPQVIQDFLIKYYGSVGRTSANGQEFIMPSPYLENDYKRHFSINTETGLFQDFKTGKVGNFTSLYAYTKNISYKRASAEIMMEEFLEEPSSKLPPPQTKPEEKPSLSLVPISIDSVHSGDDLVLRAWNFLFTRKLFNLTEQQNDEFFLCVEGKYKNRLIIPFNTSKGEMYYFQARALLVDQKPKYLNPSEGYPKPSHILYPYDKNSNHLIICEGPLDAISLQLQGINATCTMGGHISAIQASILADFEGKIILGYDNDEAGGRGIKAFERLRKEKLMGNFYILQPPTGHKDWNDAHIAKVDLRTHMLENTQEYTYEYTINTELNQL